MTDTSTTDFESILQIKLNWLYFKTALFTISELPVFVFLVT